MREDYLLALRRRAFVSTTDSNHDSTVYADLRPEPNVTGVIKLWVADMTYISVSRRGNPYDNAQTKRFIRTLKYKEVYLYEYESLEEARPGIGCFIDKLDNRKRLHSAPDCKPPDEFEQMMTCVKTVA